MFPIPPIRKAANSPCPHCAGGCSIWETKPQICSDFECAYYQSDAAPPGLRPDRCGIIFSKKTDRVFSAVVVGPIAEIAKGQIQDFLKQGFSVVAVSIREKKPLVFPAPGCDPDSVFREYEAAISGNIQH